MAISGLALTFPFMNVLTSFGMLVGNGAAARISIALGEGDHAKAERILAHAFVLTFMVTGTAIGLSLAFMDDILTLFGGTERTIRYAEEYMRIIIPFACFSALCYSFNSIMRATGYPRQAMWTMIICALVNVVLDPLFIFVCDMGVAGAALATVISQVCSFTLLLYMATKGGNIPIRYRNFTPSFAFIKEIIGGGTPSLARQGLASLSTILLNLAAGAYGDAAIAGMSIVSRIGMFINSFLIGFGQGFQPLCGFCYGAGLYSRVRQGFWLCVRIGFIFLTCCAVLGFGFAEEVVELFRKGDPAVVATGASALRWQLVTYPLGTFVIISNMMLQTIRKSVRATILSSARQGLFFVPFIFILPHFFGLQGVEMCQAVSDICTFLLALPLTFGVLLEMKRQENGLKS